MNRLMNRAMNRMVGAPLLALFSLCSSPALRAHTYPAQMPGARMTKTEKQILEVERQWDAAVTAKDRATIERLLAPDFIATDIYGNVHTRADYVRALTSPSVVYDFHHSDQIIVHAYDQTAVAVGLVSVKARFDNSDISNNSRFTRVYVRSHGHWIAVVEQATRLPAAQ